MQIKKWPYRTKNATLIPRDIILSKAQFIVFRKVKKKKKKRLTSVFRKKLSPLQENIFRNKQIIMIFISIHRHFMFCNGSIEKIPIYLFSRYLPLVWHLLLWTNKIPMVISSVKWGDWTAKPRGGKIKSRTRVDPHNRTHNIYRSITDQFSWPTFKGSGYNLLNQHKPPNPFKWVGLGSTHMSKSI